MPGEYFTARPLDTEVWLLKAGAVGAAAAAAPHDFWTDNLRQFARALW